MEKFEKQSSIEVSRNAKGEYSFKIKFYFDEEETSAITVNNRAEETMRDLKRRFNVD